MGSGLKIPLGNLNIGGWNIQKTGYPPHNVSDTCTPARTQAIDILGSFSNGTTPINLHTTILAKEMQLPKAGLLFILRIGFDILEGTD
jgi:hypothetical protein